MQSPGQHAHSRYPRPRQSGQRSRSSAISFPPSPCRPLFEYHTAGTLGFCCLPSAPTCGHKFLTEQAIHQSFGKAECAAFAALACTFCYDEGEESGLLCAQQLLPCDGLGIALLETFQFLTAKAAGFDGAQADCLQSCRSAQHRLDRRRGHRACKRNWSFATPMNRLAICIEQDAVPTVRRCALGVADILACQHLDPPKFIGARL